MAAEGPETFAELRPLGTKFIVLPTGNVGTFRRRCCFAASSYRYCSITTNRSIVTEVMRSRGTAVRSTVTEITSNTERVCFSEDGCVQSPTHIRTFVQV